MAKEKSIVPIERIAAQIYLIRSESVILDADLAELYHVETGALVRAMKRNLDRFPEDFAFQLSKEEFDDLRSQTGISSWALLISKWVETMVELPRVMPPS